MEFLLENLTTIIVGVLSFLGGGFTCKIISKKVDHSTESKQEGNLAGGDIAGRDIKK